MSDPFERPPEPAARRPASWQQTAVEFIDSRIELIRLEARSAGRHMGQRIAWVALVAMGACLTWLLMLAGLIGWIASIQDVVPWYGLTLLAALAHLLVALVGIAWLRQPVEPPFPITRNELAKDKEWLQRLKNHPPTSKP